MSKPFDVNQRSPDELVIRCHCGGDHFVTISASPLGFPDDDFVYLGVAEVWRRPRGLFGRVKAIWQMLWTAEFHAAEAGLNLVDLEKLGAWCEDKVAELKVRD